MTPRDMTVRETTKAAKPLPIAVVSDVVCPWCYLGKRRLEAALVLAPGIDVAVRWKPFRLDPTIPRSGIERRRYLENKFGSLEAVRPAHDQLTALGQAAGIDFRFDRITRSPNTVDAHRLIRWSEQTDRQDTVVDRLFHAYFTDGLDIGDRGVLSAVAADSGLDPEETARRLASDEDRGEVEAEIKGAYRIGITGVPSFVIDHRYAIVGAHPAETLADALAEIAALRVAQD